ncbi:hypothetical protein [Sulfuracidifex metallicus]|nr:hypothetical protein [Sulfuracidifex metallicus]
MLRRKNATPATIAIPASKKPNPSSKLMLPADAHVEAEAKAIILCQY